MSEDKYKPNSCLNDIVKILDTISIRVSTRTIQLIIEIGYMESDHDEPFSNHVTSLLGLILPKLSWTKKITFRNKYNGVIKEKLSF